ncbi:MAG: TldD/PmbA family protein [Clostridia bacterium]|nr:TldD/PmbA family protein [Clostridia bacterium]
MIKDLLSPYKNFLSDHTELRAQVNASRAVALIGGNLVNNLRTEQSGVSARVYKNGVYGFASGTEYSEDSIKNIIKAAGENAIFLASRAGTGKSLPVISSGEKVMNGEIRDCEQKLYIDFAKEVDKYIEKKYPKLVSRKVIVRCDSMEKLLRVNDGYDSYSLVPRSYVIVIFTAEANDGTNVELYKVFGGYGFFADVFSTPDKLFAGVDELYENIIKKAEGVYAEAGYRDVVMHPNLAGILAHEAVGHTVEADMVLSGSVAAHNLNKQIASPLVTMIDFAHTQPNGSPVPLPVFVDDEGTPAEDAILIKDGVLTGYMNNRESAEHFGVKPQGNARAYAFSDEPLIRMRNTAILPGTSSIEDMIASIDDGYFLTETNNGQADTTGEFMFGVGMGYEIKKGKLGRAIRDTTISGVAFDMLKTVDMLSNDMVWTSSGMCGKKQPMPVGMGGPAIKCKITIGGR